MISKKINIGSVEDELTTHKNLNYLKQKPFKLFFFLYMNSLSDGTKCTNPPNFGSSLGLIIQFDLTDRHDSVVKTNFTMG